MKPIISYASVHCLERAKERLGFNEKNAAKEIQRATERGKPAEAFTSWERDFLKNHSREKKRAVAYNGFCYVIDEETGFCITVFRLPPWFGRKKSFDGKKKVKNLKKYMKYKEGKREILYR